VNLQLDFWQFHGWELTMALHDIIYTMVPNPLGRTNTLSEASFIVRLA